MRASRKGFFLRAETMHAFYSYLEGVGFEEDLHGRSHGESFLDLIAARWRVRGLWVLDEPEAGLSLSGCLARVRLLRDQVERGSQAVISTHSPALAAHPGADLLEAGSGASARAPTTTSTSSGGGAGSSRRRSGS